MLLYRVKCTLPDFIIYWTQSAAYALAEGILGNIWLDWSQGFGELGETELCIAIQIKPAHDCRQLCLDWLVADALKEPPYSSLINELVILRVDCFERTSDAELRHFLQIPLQLLQPELEINFFR